MEIADGVVSVSDPVRIVVVGIGSPIPARKKKREVCWEHTKK